MIKLHRSTDRRYVRSGSQEMWMTFDPGNGENPSPRGFHALESFNEIKLSPGTDLQFRPDEGQEILTYVQEGDLHVCQESCGDEIFRPGYYHCTGSHRPMSSRVRSGAHARGTHLFVSSMVRRERELPISSERKHFPFSDRRGILRLIASPDGTGASLRIRQDVRVYSSLLDQGRHIVHELRSVRSAWLHVIEGRIRLVDETLKAGDGASLENEAALSLTAQEPSEILLFDLA
jgi:redox-sensitive bicupin YhaK (pirin superfamily)